MFEFQSFSGLRYVLGGGCGGPLGCPGLGGRAGGLWVTELANDWISFIIDTSSANEGRSSGLRNWKELDMIIVADGCKEEQNNFNK